MPELWQIGCGCFRRGRACRGTFRPAFSHAMNFRQVGCGGCRTGRACLGTFRPAFSHARTLADWLRMFSAGEGLQGDVSRCLFSCRKLLMGWLSRLPDGEGLRSQTDQGRQRGFRHFSLHRFHTKYLRVPKRRPASARGLVPPLQEGGGRGTLLKLLSL